MPNTPDNREEHQESADIRRLMTAGRNTDDLITQAAGIARANRLSKKFKLNITNPIIANVFNIPPDPQE